MIRISYITSLWAIKKIHVRLVISSCWHIFHCVGWAWATTCGTVRYIGRRVRFLLDWRILKIVILNLARLEILESLNVLINRFISNKMILFLAIVLWRLLRLESFSSTKVVNVEHFIHWDSIKVEYVMAPVQFVSNIDLLFS